MTDDELVTEWIHAQQWTTFLGTTQEAQKARARQVLRPNIDAPADVRAAAVRLYAGGPQ